MNLTHTFSFSKNEISSIASRLVEELSQLKIKPESVKSPYELARYKGSDVTVVVFSSGKILVQGKGTDRFVENFQKIIEQKTDTKVVTPQVAYRPHIGVDEVGKGDYFGPLVACAAYCSQNDYSRLLNSGAADSKKLSDSKIVQIASELKKFMKFKVSVLLPIEYSEMLDKYRNVAIVLANLHATVIEELLTELQDENLPCDEIVIDQFSAVEDRVSSLLGERSKKMKFSQMHKAESDPIIAAASILARDEFLSQWESMESEWGMKFPKGATHVIESGNEFLSLHGKENLRKVAKVSFRTTSQLNI